MEKSVVVFSGGMDSVTLLHYVKEMYGGPIYGLSFYYGQRHGKELKFARYWGEKLCKEHRVVVLPFMKELASKSALTSESIEVPQGQRYSHENQKITVVPNRNMIMLSIAVAWAEDLEVNKVFYAAHHNDREVYPDCRKEFVTALSLASQLGTYSHVEVLAPFVDKLKSEIVQLGIELGVDFSKTWSCYVGEERPCLRCATCLERTGACLKNGIKDPLLTDEEWSRAVEFLRGVDRDKIS